MDNDHEDSTFSTNKFNSSRLLVQARGSPSLDGDTSSSGLFKSVTNSESSDLTKKALKKQCYHDKDCTYASQNTDFNFKR